MALFSLPFRIQIAVGLLVFLGMPNLAAAATYFVDASAGNDSNPGTSQSSPWRSVGRVNNASLSPGDIVRFRRGQSFGGELDLSRSGSSGSPITITNFGSGAAPVLFQITLRGQYLTIDGVTVDHQKQSGDAVRVRGRNVTLRNMTIRNGTNDGIDATAADGLLVEQVEIHHFLAGSLGTQDDAHGIVVTNTNGVTIRGANIHHVSGDSFQSDPNREAGAISNNIRIENSELWTGPLSADFNSGWRAGDSPGENAIDTKVVKSGYDNEPRMNITLINVTAHGWRPGPAVPNRAAFNLKEKINAVLDRVTVYDCEIAFRVRGLLGNANTRISNAVVYNVDTAIRAEDNLTGLRIYNSTFGHGIDRLIAHAGGSGGVGSWDLRNNAFLSSVPSEASDPTNLSATASDFAGAGQHNYRLAGSSSLIDRGTTIAAVSVDRDGNARSSRYDVGAFEFASGGNSVPKPPTIVGY